MCDVTIASGVPLPELQQVEGERADWGFHLRKAKEPEGRGFQWFQHWRLPDGEIWLSFARVHSGYWLRFKELADFSVDSKRKLIFCHPRPRIPDNTIRHLFLNQVMPLLLSQGGELILHCSAVLSKSGVIAFLGLTGRGKSTLAASFCQNGFPFLADDCLLLRERDGVVVGVPSYPGLRVWPDAASALFGQEAPVAGTAHYTSKVRLGLDNGGLPYCGEPAPLARVYVLDPNIERSNDPDLNPLSPREAFLELVKHSFRLDVTDMEKLREQFQLTGRVVDSSLVCRLSFRQDFSLLPWVREAVTRNLVA